MMNLDKNQIKHQSIINIIEQSSTAEPKVLNAAIYQLFITFRAYLNPDLRHPCPQLLAVQAGADSAIEQKDEKPIVQMSIISLINFRAGTSRCATTRTSVTASRLRKTGAFI
jgi:hypothetical protein